MEIEAAISDSMHSQDVRSPLLLGSIGSNPRLKKQWPNITTKA